MTINLITEPPKNLASRVLSGEIFILRGVLNRQGLIEEMRAASLEGIEQVAGKDVSVLVRHKGFETIHQSLDSSQFPILTDKIYKIVAPKTADWLTSLAPELFGEETSIYFEREPNIRFLPPYGLSQAHRAEYRQFARQHGEGKITAHGPHRDSWLDCPDNAINVWIAVGPVRKGNGMSFFPERHQSEVRRTQSGAIAYDEDPGTPINFELTPGDAVIFHGDHLHASELNRTDETRHVMSFRLTMGKPHFPNGHYHHYLNLSLVPRWGTWFAGLPANLAWTYLATRMKWLRQALLARLPNLRKAEGQQKESFTGTPENTRDMDLTDMEVGELRGISAKVCLARIKPDQIVAFARRCPHQGADLSLGRVQDEQVVCPWHNLHIDLHDGKSHCAGLADLRLYELSEKAGKVTLEE